MPNRYSVVHQTAAGTDLPLINSTGSATVRMAMCHLILGSDATPADAAGEFVVSRSTSVGSGGTALTENALDPLSPTASVACVGGTFTTAPTETSNSNLLMIPLNQRATFSWWAREGFELYSVLASNNGLLLKCVGMSSGTPNMNATIHWFE